MGKDIMLPCEQEKNIILVLANQRSLQESQLELSSTLKESMSQLREILLSEVANKKDIEQLKKENDLLFSRIKLVDQRVGRIEVRNAVCDGAQILARFPKVWDFYQQEQGWRRFLPAAMTFISLLLAIYISLVGSDSPFHGHTSFELDPRGSSREGAP